MGERATEVANIEMAAAWDGEEGDDWTENAARYEATDRYLHPHFERALELSPTEVVLDVGCGTGASTLHAARIAMEGRAVGIDLSTRMLSFAAERARDEGLINVTFVRGDAQVHPFEAGEFTLAISTFGTMFFNEPVAAFGNIHRAVSQGGRLVMMAWRRFEENEWLRSFFDALDAGRSLAPPGPGQPGPFGLAERAHVEQILEQSGWRSILLEPIDERIWLGADPDDAWAFVGDLGMVRGLTGSLDDHERQRALHRLREVIAGAATPDGVVLGCAAWLVTAER